MLQTCRSLRIGLRAVLLLFCANAQVNEWKENVESKGMRVNMNKTKVMISGERQMVRQKDVRWPCGVCSKGVGSNSLQCTRYQKWVHKVCSGIKGSMSKVAIHSFAEAA